MEIVITVILIAVFVALLPTLLPACVSFISSVTSGIQGLYSIAGVFPSLWSVVPSSFTNVVLGIVIMIVGIGVIRGILD